MSTQDPDVPVIARADERTHPAFSKLARACITLARLARDDRTPPEREVEAPHTGATL